MIGDVLRPVGARLERRKRVRTKAKRYEQGRRTTYLSSGMIIVLHRSNSAAICPGRVDFPCRTSTILRKPTSASARGACWDAATYSFNLSPQPCIIFSRTWQIRMMTPLDTDGLIAQGGRLRTAALFSPYCHARPVCTGQGTGAYKGHPCPVRQATNARM